VVDLPSFFCGCAVGSLLTGLCALVALALNFRSQSRRLAEIERSGK